MLKKSEIRLLIRGAQEYLRLFSAPYRSIFEYVLVRETAPYRAVTVRERFPEPPANK